MGTRTTCLVIVGVSIGVGNDSFVFYFGADGIYDLLIMECELLV